VQRAVAALEDQVWIVWAPVLLGAGILAWFLIPDLAGRRIVLALAAAVALAGGALAGRRGLLLACAGGLVALGLVAADFRARTVAAPMLYHRQAAAPVTGTLIEMEGRQGGARTRLLILRDAGPDTPPVRVAVTLAIPPPDWLQPGVRLTVPAVLGPPPPPMLPSGHDAMRRAFFDRVSATGRATGPPEQVATERAPPGAGAWMGGLRLGIAHTLETVIGGEAGAVATALVTGSQGQIAPDVLEAMRVAGLVHLLTVSGFHVGVVSTGAFMLVRWSLALWPWLALRVNLRAVAALAAGLSGTAYAIVSGGDVPAVRAAIIAWVVALAVALGRNPLSIRLLALAAFLILLIRPEVLLGPSFQLSFAAVLSLILLAGSRPGRQILAPRSTDAPLQRLGRWVLALAASGLVVELVLTPIAVTHFGRSGLYGMLANMAAIPLTAFLVMPLLALTLVAVPLGAGPAVALLLRPALDALIGIGTTVAAWPGALMTTASVPLSAQLAALAGGLMLALFTGPLRLFGMIPLGAALLLFATAKHPDILVSPDGTHVGIVRGETLHMLRATRGGFAERVFMEASNSARLARIDALPGARCTRDLCLVIFDGETPLRLLAIRSSRRLDLTMLTQACAAADVVVAPRRLPDACTPRWLLLDREALKATGALTIDSRTRRIDSVGARSGDHPWSPAALPGRVQPVLGPPIWRDPLPE
jgi:competence protein ComEC